MKYECNLVYVVFSDKFVDYCPRFEGGIVFKPEDSTPYTISRDA